MTVLQRIVYLTAYLIHFLSMDKSELDYDYVTSKYSKDVYHVSVQREPALTVIAVIITLTPLLTFSAFLLWLYA